MMHNPKRGGFPPGLTRHRPVAEHPYWRCCLWFGCHVQGITIQGHKNMFDLRTHYCYGRTKAAIRRHTPKDTHEAS